MKNELKELLEWILPAIVVLTVCMFIGSTIINSSRDRFNKEYQECTDKSCVCTDYHIEVCLKDTVTM